MLILSPNKKLLLLLFFILPVFSIAQEPDPEEREANLIQGCAAATIKRPSVDVLEIKLGNGKLLSFKNKDEGEATEKYTFEGCLSSFNAYLFEVMGWETISWILLDKKNGTKVTIASLPVLSPDKKRLICTTSGENEAGFDANYLEIWSFVNGKPKKDFELSGMSWGAGKAIWVTNTSIKVEAEKYDGSETKKLKPKIVSLINGKWVVK